MLDLYPIATVMADDALPGTVADIHGAMTCKACDLITLSVSRVCNQFVPVGFSALDKSIEVADVAIGLFPSMAIWQLCPVDEVEGLRQAHLYAYRDVHTHASRVFCPPEIDSGFGPFTFLAWSVIAKLLRCCRVSSSVSKVMYVRLIAGVGYARNRDRAR